MTSHAVVTPAIVTLFTRPSRVSSKRPRPHVSCTVPAAFVHVVDFPCAAHLSSYRAAHRHLAMGRRFKKAMTPESDDSDSSSELDAVEWKYTTTMNMFDLSRDDDYCSYLFVEKLGKLGGGAPLLVHKMDSRRVLPKTDTVDVLNILRRVSKLPPAS